jgi:hypothetical protein
VFALHNLFFYSDTPPSPHHSFRVAQTIFEPKLFPYQYPNNIIPVIFSAYTAYDDGIECSEKSVYKIQAPENHPK